MERKIYKELLSWKHSEDRKPLILQGARQVGKTYILNYFASREYANSIYCNFEREPALAEFFSDLNPHNILKKLSVYKRREVFPAHTLIIFDEIQACPLAITSLKYFMEDAGEYHIVASGSLLGVSVNRGDNSFPVGKVQFATLYPLDFEEYLMARGEGGLASLIRERYESGAPMESLFHERALDYYEEYLFVGGMPEAVEEYNKNKSPDLVRVIQKSILEAYHNDMGKYNRQSEIPKTRIVYKSVSTQLAKENRKFQYKDIKKGGRASEFESAIEWLCLAGIAAQNFRVEQIMLPLNAYRSLTDFKFYMSDVGLLCASQDIYFDDIIQDNVLLRGFKGGLAENYVFSQLKSSGFPLYYWTSGNQAEVDFITRIGNDIIPIEVKSDTNTRSKSLALYIEKQRPSYSVRISAKNFGEENGIKSIPLYAVFCIQR